MQCIFPRNSKEILREFGGNSKDCRAVMRGKETAYSAKPQRASCIRIIQIRRFGIYEFTSSWNSMSSHRCLPIDTFCCGSSDTKSKSMFHALRPPFTSWTQRFSLSSVCKCQMTRFTSKREKIWRKISLSELPIGEIMPITTGRYLISIAHGKNRMQRATALRDQSSLNPQPWHQRYRQPPIALPPVPKAVEREKNLLGPHQKIALVRRKIHIRVSMHH